MDVALTTFALLPGVISLSIATAPRCRAIAPRDLPAALVGTLAFTLADFGLAIVLCKLAWGAPSLGTMAAVLVTGEAHEGTTREAVLADLFGLPWQCVVGLLFLFVSTFLTGGVVSWVYRLLLRVIAVEEGAPGIKDSRGKIERWCAAVLRPLTHLAIARGASYWLVVQQIAKLLRPRGRPGPPEVFADITQGDDATLFAGQVLQVITSPTGEVHSIVLKTPRRYRRDKYSDPDANGQRKLLKEGEWVKISNSEAFFMRGDNVHNISYRLYGDLDRGGWSMPMRTTEGRMRISLALREVLRQSSYAKEKFGNLPSILNRNEGTLRDRILRAFVEVFPCQKQDYPSLELHAEFERLRAEATTEPGDTGRLNKTIAKMTETQLASMRDQLLDLAQRIVAAPAC